VPNVQKDLPRRPEEKKCGGAFYLGGKGLKLLGAFQEGRKKNYFGNGERKKRWRNVHKVRSKLKKRGRGGGLPLEGLGGQLTYNIRKIGKGRKITRLRIGVGSVVIVTESGLGHTFHRGPLGRKKLRPSGNR